VREEGALSRRNFVAAIAMALTIAACGPSAQELVDQQVELVFAALDAGDVEAARAALSEAEKIRGASVPSAARQAVVQRESASLAFLAAQDHQAQGDYLEAIENFRRAAERDPWFTSAAFEGVSAVESAYVDRELAAATQALEDGDIDAALSSLTLAIANFPSNPDLGVLAERVAEEYESAKIDEIEELLRSGDPAKARQIAQRAASQLGATTPALDRLIASAEEALAAAAAARQAALDAERAARERERRDIARRIGCEGSSPRSVAHCTNFRAQRVVRADLGDRWPLTIAAGTVICSSQGTRQIATFLPDGSSREYALNGTADSMGWPTIRPIWADDDRPGFRGQGIKKSIGPLVSAALAVC
jgi:tetratricopeptide (TPR) repeat protein